APLQHPRHPARDRARARARARWLLHQDGQGQPQSDSKRPALCDDVRHHCHLRSRFALVAQLVALRCRELPPHQTGYETAPPLWPSWNHAAMLMKMKMKMKHGEHHLLVHVLTLWLLMEQRQRSSRAQWLPLNLQRVCPYLCLVADLMQMCRLEEEMRKAMV